MTSELKTLAGEESFDTTLHSGNVTTPEENFVEIKKFTFNQFKCLLNQRFSSLEEKLNIIDKYIYKISLTKTYNKVFSVNERILMNQQLNYLKEYIKNEMLSVKCKDKFCNNRFLKEHGKKYCSDACKQKTYRDNVYIKKGSQEKR